jgi:hypothetical protein
MGNPVRGLTRNDFVVKEDKNIQNVLSFDYFDGSLPSYVPKKLPTLPTNTFVNLPREPEQGPLYVLYYDMVNTFPGRPGELVASNCLTFVDKAHAGHADCHFCECGRTASDSGVHQRPRAASRGDHLEGARNAHAPPSFCMGEFRQAGCGRGNCQPSVYCRVSGWNRGTQESDLAIGQVSGTARARVRRHLWKRSNAQGGVRCEGCLCGHDAQPSCDLSGGFEGRGSVRGKQPVSRRGRRSRYVVDGRNWATQPRGDRRNRSHRHGRTRSDWRGRGYSGREFGEYCRPDSGTVRLFGYLSRSVSRGVHCQGDGRARVLQQQQRKRCAGKRNGNRHELLHAQLFADK